MARKKNSGDFLKECMADALFILLQTKSIEEITISEVTALANVSRITYYRNFTSKESMIEFKLDKLIDEWIRANLSVMLLNRLILKFHGFNTPDRNEYYRQIFISFGLCGIILTWIDNDMKESPEEMAKTVSRRFFHSQIYNRNVFPHKKRSSHHICDRIAFLFI